MLAHTKSTYCPGGPLLAQGGPLLAQGGPLLAQGGPLLAQGGPLLAHGGPLLAHGGPLLAQGGPLLAQGGPLLAQGGPLLAQEGPLLTCMHVAGRAGCLMIILFQSATRKREEKYLRIQLEQQRKAYEEVKRQMEMLQSAQSDAPGEGRIMAGSSGYAVLPSSDHAPSSDGQQQPVPRSDSAPDDLPKPDSPPISSDSAPDDLLKPNSPTDSDEGNKEKTDREKDLPSCEPNGTAPTAAAAVGNGNAVVFQTSEAAPYLVRYQ